MTVSCCVFRLLDIKKDINWNQSANNYNSVQHQRLKDLSPSLQPFLGLSLLSLVSLLLPILDPPFHFLQLDGSGTFNIRFLTKLLKEVLVLPNKTPPTIDRKETEISLLLVCFTLILRWSLNRNWIPSCVDVSTNLRQ